MNHEINYLSESKNTYTVKVDGKEIVFSKTRNNIKYGDVAALNAFIMTVQKRAEGNETTFNDLAKTMNSANLLRVLDALFSDQTVSLWSTFYKNHSSLSIYKMVSSFFGARVHLDECQLDLVGRIQNAAEAIQGNPVWQRLIPEVREMEKSLKMSFDPDKYYASNSKWTVKRIGDNNNNLIIYSVNDKNIEICLSGRKEFSNASVFLNVVSALFESLVNKKADEVKKTIQMVGGRAAQRMMAALFKDEAIQFFLDEQSYRVHTNRELPTPRKLLKEFLVVALDGNMFF